MKEAIGDLWDYPADWRIIPTNGSVRSDGACVIGRGVARQAAAKFPELPRALGAVILAYGNHVRLFQRYKIITLPVKHEWYHTANIELIERGLRELMDGVKCPMSKFGPVTFALPRPGCGNDALEWRNVKPLCESILDDCFTLVHRRADLLNDTKIPNSERPPITPRRER